MEKGLSYWVLMSLVIILILLVLIGSELINMNLLGRSGEFLDESQIRGVCDHIICPSGCRDGDNGKKYDERECIKNLTHTFRDRCANAEGDLGTSHVKEFFCVGNRIDFEIHYCGTMDSCFEGACQ